MFCWDCKRLQQRPSLGVTSFSKQYHNETFIDRSIILIHNKTALRCACLCVKYVSNRLRFQRYAHRIIPQSQWFCYHRKPMKYNKIKAALQAHMNFMRSISMTLLMIKCVTFREIVIISQSWARFCLWLRKFSNNVYCCVHVINKMCSCTPVLLI